MNSLLPTDHDEQRIRETAYHLWEKDGRPMGQADRYWQMAQSIAESIDVLPSPAAAPSEQPQKSKKTRKPSAAKSKLLLARSAGAHVTH